ncbi:4134_t:CDS:2, partial [Acaulospora morrowiae]
MTDENFEDKIIQINAQEDENIIELDTDLVENSTNKYGTLGENADDLMEAEIIIRKLEDHRELHFISREDVNKFDEIYAWVKAQNATLKETIENFSKEYLGDAIAKSIFDYPFPDFIIKFREDPKDQDYEEHRTKRCKFERFLLYSGMIVECEVDVIDEFTYMKIIAPFERLCEQAQQMKLKMPLNRENIQHLDLPREKQSMFHPIIKHFSYKLNPNKNSAFFKKDRLEEFEGASITNSKAEVILNFFSMAKRNLMVHRIIIAAHYLNHKITDDQGNELPCKIRISSLSIDRLVKDKAFIGYYPLHDGPSKKVDTSKVENMRAELNEAWVKSFERQPLAKVREYFGEKLTLYFTWIGSYTNWLVVASVGGVIVTIYGLIDALIQGSLVKGVGGISVIIDNALTAPYAFFMSVW